MSRKSRRAGLLVAGATVLLLSSLVPRVLSGQCSGQDALWETPLFEGVEQAPLTFSVFVSDHGLMELLPGVLNVFREPMLQRWGDLLDRVLPGRLGQMVRGLEPRLSVSDVRFLRPQREELDGQRIYIRVRFSLRSPDFSQFMDRARAAIHVEIDLPIELAREGQQAELRTALSGGTVRSVSFEVAGRSVRTSAIEEDLSRDLERLLSIPTLLARFEPLEAEGLNVGFLPNALSAERSDLLRVDLEVDGLRAPAVGRLPAPEQMQEDRPVVLAIHEAAAGVLVDQVLRELSMEGMKRDGTPGGPYRARVMSVRVEDDRNLQMEMLALRSRCPCGWVRLGSRLALRESAEGISVRVEHLEVRDSTRPRLVVRKLLPGRNELGDHATAMLQQALRMENLDIPILGDVEVYADRIETSHAVLFAHARLRVR